VKPLTPDDIKRRLAEWADIAGSNGIFAPPELTAGVPVQLPVGTFGTADSIPVLKSGNRLLQGAVLGIGAGENVFGGSFEETGVFDIMFQTSSDETTISPTWVLKHTNVSDTETRWQIVGLWHAFGPTPAFRFAFEVVTPGDRIILQAQVATTVTATVFGFAVVTARFNGRIT